MSGEYILKPHVRSNEKFINIDLSWTPVLLAIILYYIVFSSCGFNWCYTYR